MTITSTFIVFHWHSLDTTESIVRTSATTAPTITTTTEARGAGPGIFSRPINDSVFTTWTRLWNENGQRQPWRRGPPQYVILLLLLLLGFNDNDDGHHHHSYTQRQSQPWRRPPPLFPSFLLLNNFNNDDGGHHHYFRHHKHNNSSHDGHFLQLGELLYIEKQLRRRRQLPRSRGTIYCLFISLAGFLPDRSRFSLFLFCYPYTSSSSWCIAPGDPIQTIDTSIINVQPPFSAPQTRVAPVDRLKSLP